MVLAKVLAAYKAQEGLNYRELGQRIGCCYSTLWRFLSGKPCDDRTLVRVLVWLLEEREK